MYFWVTAEDEEEGQTSIHVKAGTMDVLEEDEDDDDDDDEDKAAKEAEDGDDFDIIEAARKV